MHVGISHNPRRAWIPILLALALTAAPALASAQVSLATVVDLAQRNSSTVKLAEAEVQKAKAALAETRDAFVPSVSFGSGLPAFPEVGFSGGVPSILNATVQSSVFSLPQLHYIDAARTGLRAAFIRLKDAKEQVALDVSTSYVELDMVNRELEAASQQESFAGQLVKIEQERAEAGVDPLSNSLQARLTAAQLKLKRIHLETRAAILSKQLATLSGLPVASIAPDRTTIPEIPQVRAGEPQRLSAGVESAQVVARSKERTAQGDSLYMLFPQISFAAQYNRSTRLLNNADTYYKSPIPTTNFNSGFQIQVSLFDFGHSAKARASAADALRATVEAEQAQQQNDIQIASLTGSLRELDALVEVASIKQQIAGEQVKAVEAQLELGNGAGSGPGAPPQMTPKDEQLARIDERQKFEDALEAGFDLSKARLELLRALGHMEDWLQELHAK